jgi:hypothetical protein
MSLELVTTFATAASASAIAASILALIRSYIKGREISRDIAKTRIDVATELAAQDVRNAAEHIVRFEVRTKTAEGGEVDVEELRKAILHLQRALKDLNVSGGKVEFHLPDASDSKTTAAERAEEAARG